MKSAPTTTAPRRCCIVNCYPAASRERFDLLDVGHPHDMFKDVLAREAPNATTGIVYVADLDFALPPGTLIDDPRVASQISFASLLMEQGAASWGSCWGIQMASPVSGGEVAVNPRGRAADPDLKSLREELDVGDGTIDPQIRELELRNWLQLIDSRAK